MSSSISISTQHIAREELALGNGLLTTFHFNHFFDRNQNLTKEILHTITRNALLKGAHYTTSRSRE